MNEWPWVVIMRNILIRKISWSIKYGKRLVEYMLVRSFGRRKRRREHKKIDLLTTFLFEMESRWCGHVWKMMSNILTDSDSEKSSNFLTNYSISWSHSSLFLTCFIFFFRRPCDTQQLRCKLLRCLSVVGGWNKKKAKDISEGCNECKTKYCESLKIISRRAPWKTIHSLLLVPDVSLK